MHPQSTVARARELRARGLMASEIAQAVGVHERSVRRWVVDMPLTDTQQQAAEERRKQRFRAARCLSNPEPDPIPGVLWVYRCGEWLKALVDIDDWQGLREYRWNTASLGYPVTKFNGRREYLHRMLFGLTPNAQWPDGQRIVIDHLNRNVLDNRRVNLHAGTQKDNCANRGGIFEKRAA